MDFKKLLENQYLVVAIIVIVLVSLIYVFSVKENLENLKFVGTAFAKAPVTEIVAPSLEPCEVYQEADGLDGIHEMKHSYIPGEDLVGEFYNVTPFEAEPSSSELL